MNSKINIECNICGGNRFRDVKKRLSIRCSSCNSIERTRAMMLRLNYLGLPTIGQRVLHLAPELGLAKKLAGIVGEENYCARDLNPETFKDLNVERLDLCTQSETLTSNYYDVIIHNHVLEHLPCNYSAVLMHLHRALKPSGVHLCSMPISRGAYEDSWGQYSDEEKTVRFGQNDHVRRFGIDDIESTLGMLFKLPQKYDLESEFSQDILDRYNIPSYARKNFSPHTVFLFRKDDIKV